MWTQSTIQLRQQASSLPNSPLPTLKITSLSSWLVCGLLAVLVLFCSFTYTPRCSTRPITGGISPSSRMSGSPMSTTARSSSTPKTWRHHKNTLSYFQGGSPMELRLSCLSPSNLWITSSWGSTLSKSPMQLAGLSTSGSLETRRLMGWSSSGYSCWNR